MPACRMCNHYKRANSLEVFRRYGETEPVYNTLFRRFANEDIDLNLQDTLPYIKRVESIPDKEYREIFRPYAEALHG